MQHSDCILRRGQDVPPLFLEYSSLVPVKQDLLLASTWNGRCILLDARTGDVELQPLVSRDHAGTTLDVPSVASGKPTLFAVSGRVSWASVWRRGDDVARMIYPNQANAVSAVALSPDGEAIAIGTGRHPLTRETRKAAVEIWSLEEEQRCIASTLLSDVVVMGLDWHPSSGHLLALTGTIEQDGGHLWLLECPSLIVASSSAIKGGLPKKAAFLDRGSSAIVVGRHHVEQRHTASLDRIARYWSITPEISHAAISSASSEVLLSTGQLLCAGDNTVRTLNLPPQCAATAILPSGGYVAMTADGLLRVWNRP